MPEVVKKLCDVIVRRDSSIKRVGPPPLKSQLLLCAHPIRSRGWLPVGLGSLNKIPVPALMIRRAVLEEPKASTRLERGAQST